MTGYIQLHKVNGKPPNRSILLNPDHIAWLEQDRHEDGHLGTLVHMVGLPAPVKVAEPPRMIAGMKPAYEDETLAFEEDKT